MIDEGSFHPLFPPEDEHHKPIAIKAIYVKRFETSGMVSALRPFAPEELQSEQDLFQMFGGGTYQLQARDERGRVDRTVRITIPGPKKSMLGDVAIEDAPPAMAPRPSESMGHGGTGSTVLDYLLMQNQELREERKAAREEAARREEREREREREDRQARETDQRQWMLMVVDAMKGGTGLTERLIDRALTPAPPPAPRDVLADAKGILDLAKSVKKGSDDTETVSTIAQSVAAGLVALSELAKTGDKAQQQQPQQQQQQAPPESQQQPQHQGAVG